MFFLCFQKVSPRDKHLIALILHPETCCYIFCRHLKMLLLPHMALSGILFAIFEKQILALALSHPVTVLAA